MPSTLEIRDETASGELKNSLKVEIAGGRTTLRELIQRRIQQEVEAFNKSEPEYFKGLVRPTETEADLNGYRFKKGRHRKVDWREQYEKAIEAFEANGFFVLAGDRQVETLDEPIDVGEPAQVSFVRLVPLVGG